MRLSIFLALFCLVLPCAATNYFVTQAGAGSHTGTSLGNAWSVANFNASGTPTGGDAVFFSGTITSQVVPNSSGTGTGVGNLTLDFTAATVNVATSGEIFLDGVSHVTLLGGAFATDSAGAGNILIQCFTVSASDVTISGWSYTGSAGGTDTFVIVGSCTSITIQNNTMDNVVSAVQQFQGANNGPVTILNNYFRTSINTATQTDVINMGDTRNVLIQGNMLIQRSPGDNGSGQHNDVIQTYQGGGSSNQTPSAWTVRYNWIGLEMTTVERTGDNSWMQLESFSNASGFGIKIYANIFEGGATDFSGNNGFGADSHGIASNCYVFNNTIIRKNGPDRTIGWVQSGTPSGSAILFMRNNTGMATSGQDSTDVDVGAWTAGTGGWDYNFWYQFDGTVTAGSTGSHGSSSTNPNFTNYNSGNYSLQSGSPLINAGDSTIGSEFNQGIAPGATWPNPALVTRTGSAWDVGAYQSSSGSTPTVSAVSPNNGTTAGGTPVTITGTNFAMGATVNFGSNAATSVVVGSATSITCSTPSGSAGAANVSVTVSGNTGTLTSGFTYTAPSGITITSPTNLQLIQVSEAFPFTASVTSLPTADHVVWTIDYQRWATGYAYPNPHTYADPSDSWTGVPFQTTWFTGRNGDGTHLVQACVYDIFGTLLTPCVTQSFIVRLQGMSNRSISGFPTSGTGTFTETDNGNAYGAADLMDGYHIGTGNAFSDPLYAACGMGGTTIVTTCWPNGARLFIRAGYPPAGNSGVFYDPVVVSKTFTSSNVSGNDITVSAHQFQNGNAAVLHTTGTLPPPLTAGTQWFWATSPTNPSNTFTVSIAAGVATFTTSSVSSVTSGTPIYVLNIQSTNQTTGASNCDGYYTTTTGIDSTHFSVPVSTACNSAVATANGELDVNPVFLQYVDGDTVSFSATPGGGTITLTGTGGSGNTIQSRLRSPYWTLPGSANGQPATEARAYSDYVWSGGVYNVYQPVTFSNGTSAMQIQVPSWEYHGYAGKTGDTACPLGILNTDGTLTAIGTGGLTCATFTYTATQDGGITNAISVNTSTGAITYANTSAWTYATGIVSPAQSAWARIAVSCATCGPGGIALPTVNTYQENHGNTSASVTFPHHTTCGVVAQAFNTGLPGGCKSFIPLSVESANIESPPAWLGSALTRANFNSVMDGFTYSTVLTNPASTGPCTTWPDSTMLGASNFLATWNLYREYDMYPIWYNLGNNTVSLAAILSNTGFNRQTCLQSLLAYLTGSNGRTWRLFNDDEVTDYLGTFLQPNLTIGGANWTTTTTSGGNATFTLSGVSTTIGTGSTSASAAWNQSTGFGIPLIVAGLTTNSACNGIYLASSVNSTTWVAPTPSGCSNGLTITSTSDPGGYISFPPSPLSFNAPFSGANPGSVNTSALPGNLSATYQQFSSTTYLTVSGSTATVHWPSHGLTTSNIIRIWYGTTANLNIVAKVASVIDANDFTFVYPGGTGGAAPTCTGSGGQCNGTTDSAAYFTVDPSWGANPLQQFYSIVNGVTNVPVTGYSILGAFFEGGTSIPTMYSYEGNPNNTASAWLYVPQYPPPYLGPDVSVNEAMTAADSTSGIATRAYHLRPRTMLYAEGYAGGGNIIQNCRSFSFNPACDRPGQLNDRRETAVAQIMGSVLDGLTGVRMYGLLQDTTDAYSHFCCGWGTTGTFGTGGSMNPTTQPSTWAAVAQTNAFLTMTADTRLQPEGNKPYLGPYFKTDVHTNATYGNSLTVLCGSEMPYGSLTVALNQISGGSTLKYTTDGWTTRVSTVAGNPTSVTGEFCSHPGITTMFVSQPPGYTALDNITFAPPSPLPFGASKFLVQIGYYPDDMRFDQATDCTSGCTIAVDHHNINAWYRVTYTDSNDRPKAPPSQPALIASQGLP
jgi:IPT/TIG domain